MFRTPLFTAVVLVAALGSSAVAQTQTVDSTFLTGMRWRPIGPANMMGRVTDIEGLPSPSHTFYVASVAGGIWKTTNGGTMFRPIFQNERVASMGDLAIAPSDSMQIWAGTGEEDSRNTISPGGGIYKSNDGGLTWKSMGLEKTEHIGRIVVHPTNPNIVYVAALGAAWRNNPERGIYKTEDGGANWKMIKFISDKAGFVDIVMDPTDPNVLFAASWQRVRGPYFLNSGGPGSALWKTTDGGKRWTEVKGRGLPETNKGRIGLAIAPSNHNVIYALVEAEPPGGGRGKNPPAGTPRNNCPYYGAGGCGLYRSNDGGAVWQWLNGNDVRPFYYSQVRVDVKNPERVYWSSTPLNFSNDGGKTIGTTSTGIHVDHHAMWLDPTDENHFIIGNDGGIAQTWDKGGSFDYLNRFPIGQFYIVSFDMRVPYWVCGGLQDNGSWCGPSRKASSTIAITNHDWLKFNGGDGFYTAQDPNDWHIIYGESQGGGMTRFDLRTGTGTSLRKPSWLDRYRSFEDSIIVERGDTSKALITPLQKHLQDLRVQQVTDSVALNLRWNWNTPFFLSPHNPNVFYAGANRVMRSTMRGDSLAPVSPDLTYHDSLKIRISTRTTGGVTQDTTGAETFATIVSLAESPLRAGMLFAGTDDGRLWTTADDGKTWHERTAAFAKLVPAGTYVSRIEPSRASDARYYVTFDNHRNGDFAPYVFVTDDAGKTFRSIASNLPRGGPDYVHVIREDPVNLDLLYLGTDVGAYVSLDRGLSWAKFMNGLPTVPVHDLRVHPRDRELIAATHGRSIWIVDVAPLQQYSAQLLASPDPMLFLPKPALAYRDAPGGGDDTGQGLFQAQSPPFGAEIPYWVPSASAGASARAQIIVLSEKGDTMQTIKGSASRGLQRVYWNLRKRAVPRALSPAERRDSIVMAPRVAFVADSLVRSGMAQATIDRSVAQWRQQQRGTPIDFASGSGGGQPGGGSQPITTGGSLSGALGAYNPRPAEVAPRAPGMNAPPVSATPSTEPGAADQDMLRTLSALLGMPAGRPNLRPNSSFDGFQPFVDAGTYSVILKIGERTSTQKLTVIRAEGANGAAAPSEDKWDE